MLLPHTPAATTAAAAAGEAAVAAACATVCNKCASEWDLNEAASVCYRCLHACLLACSSSSISRRSGGCPFVFAGGYFDERVDAS